MSKRPGVLAVYVTQHRVLPAFAPPPQGKIMRHHCTQGKKLVTGKSFGRDYVQCCIIFGIAKDPFLRSATIVKQYDAFDGFSFIGHDSNRPPAAGETR